MGASSEDRVLYTHALINFHGNSPDVLKDAVSNLFTGYGVLSEPPLLRRDYHEYSFRVSRPDPVLLNDMFLRMKVFPWRGTVDVVFDVNLYHTDYAPDFNERMERMFGLVFGDGAKIHCYPPRYSDRELRVGRKVYRMKVMNCVVRMDSVPADAVWDEVGRVADFLRVANIFR